MKNFLLGVIALTLLSGCASISKSELVGSFYPNSVVEPAQSNNKFTYYWVSENSAKKAILVYLPGKGKSGPYKLEILMDMNGVMKNIRTVNHPGLFGPKVDGAVANNRGKNITEEITVDTVSGATISSTNAERVIRRHKQDILKLLEEK